MQTSSAMVSTSRATVCAVLVFALISIAAPATAHPVLPADFVAESVAPGASFNTPTGIAFRPDGSLLVAEKRGRVYVVDGGFKVPTPLWSRENEVLDQQDRGLLDVAVDPNYASNRYIYLLYTVDPDSNGVDNNSDGFGRIARYTVSSSDPNQLVSSSRTILLGVDWPNGPVAASPTHTIGSLRWGEDGSLLVSEGDGAQYQGTDAGGNDPGAFGAGKTDPNEDIGAFRAQDITSLAGKILRINPANGHGYPSNPYWNGDATSVRSRVWAYGVRNPFRFNVRPGTGNPDPAAGDPGTLYIGDVGWGTWEEVTVAPYGGLNFGWPCWEGFAYNTSYQNATPAHNDCASMGSGTNPATHTPPLLDWHHSIASSSHPPGYSGRAASGLAFYDGVNYPAQYQGAFFHADYNNNWIRWVKVDASDNLVSTDVFGTNMDGPVDLIEHPTTHDLYYVAITEGDVRRIRYTGGVANLPPVAVADATPTIGVVPLEVSFSSAASYDPNGDPLTFSWIFGDGGSSNQASPVYTFNSPGTYDVLLTVFDDQGEQDSDIVTVRVTATADFPTAAVLDDFNRANGPIGGAWVDETATLVIDANALTQTGGAATTVLDLPAFGPDQEVFVTFDEVTSNAPEQDLMMKVQGTTWAAGHIEVRYEAAASKVRVNTYAPGQGWVGRATFDGITITPGDQFGARAYSDGTVEAYVNGVLVGTASVAGWPYASLGGRLGMTLDQATATRLDNFGGGDAALVFNEKPVATILAPGDSSFYADSQMVVFQGMVSDAEDDPGSLVHELRVDLHHNDHVHPGVLTSSNLVDSLLTFEHEDGTGVHLEAWLFVTDTGGLSDTSHITIFPEVDLRPSVVTVFPEEPISTTPTWFTFKIYNDGSLTSRTVHWCLVADGFELIEGDTLVAPHDSVTVSREQTVMLPSGDYTLRAVVDTFDVAVETSETNNIDLQPLHVVTGVLASDGGLPGGILLSPSRPNPSTGPTTMELALPRAARVGLSVFDVAGRAVWRSPPRAFDPGRWTLAWDGTTGGRPAAPGLYLARVEIFDGAANTPIGDEADHVLVRRVSLMR